MAAGAGTWGQWVVEQGAFRVAATKAASSVEVGKYIAQAAVQAIADHGNFSIALSGGSQPQQIRDGIAALTEEEQGKLQGEKWIVLYADERCVALDHDDSNYKGSLPALEAIGVPAAAIVAIDVSVGDPAAQAADYEGRLRTALGAQEGAVPCIDLVLLGMGPDGHTASLFPGHALLGEESALVAPITDSPKPPPTRITMTLPLINAAARVAFTAAGAGKASTIAALCAGFKVAPAGVEVEADGGADKSGDEWDLLPAGMVQPSSGELVWFVDAAAVQGTPLSTSS